MTTYKAENEIAGNEPQLTIEEAVKMPPPGMAVPGNFKFSPDQCWVSYVFSPEGSLVNQLYKFDIQKGESSILFEIPEGDFSDNQLSPEEQLRRERQRQRSLGVTQYFWAKSDNKLMVPLKGSIYTKVSLEAESKMIVNGEKSPALDPQISPDGNWVAFVQDAELYVVPFEGGEIHQITTGARGTGKTHGLAEFVAQEEMRRMHGYWWSPDSRKIAFTEVDETHIPEFTIVHQGKAETEKSAVEVHRYPFAGKENTRVRLGIVSLGGKEPLWVDFNENEEIYLARVNWMPDGKLTLQTVNRNQSILKLVEFELESNTKRLLLQENRETWINLHHMLQPIKSLADDEHGGFIWASERSGFMHLYLYDRDGNLIRPLTTGEWVVDELNGVDEAAGRVYFTSTKDGAKERHLYSVMLATGEIERITQEAGTHYIKLDSQCVYYVDRYDCIHQAPVVALRDLKNGSIVQDIYTEMDARVPQLKLKAPEMFSFENEVGTLLYGMIYHPPEKYGEGPHPTIVFVYGGPGSQQVTNSWMSTVKMIPQYLSSLGYLVMQVDNRGSARRGVVFEGALKHWTGKVEVEDQVAGVQHLAARGLVDEKRVGVFGWSYGGYMSIMCLVKAAEVFKAAVSGAPSVYWDGYDTFYTERYMGLPEDNPDGYQKSTPTSYLDGMQGKLMLVHGLIDENVHFRHTARFINELIAANKDYELVLLPDARHSMRKPQDVAYYLKRMSRFFQENL
ncbi:MAG: S9 family peptidase [Anaerolineaceae bacterium]|nr:S9 family peptidase [Anaerolineaceae bacterium]